MRICIHRGTHEIGGTCIEIESQGKRIVLDVGLPLDVADADAMPLHPIPGFDKPNPSLLGVVISHPHQDHYGLAHRLPPETTFLMGEAARSILIAAAAFAPSRFAPKHFIPLVDRHPIKLPPFTITPYLVDHSAYDSYAVLVEADGRHLFYTGDFRAHGRKGQLVERLIADPPRGVDMLLMEGTNIGRDDHAYPTEEELVPQLTDLFRDTKGLSLIWASGQNIDRLVTIYKACRRAGRQFIIDLYTAHVLRATGNDRLPQASWRDINVLVPQSQRHRIWKDKRFDLIDRIRPYRVYPEDLPLLARRSVMLFRPSLIRDLESIGGLKIGRLVCSIWRGYLDDPANEGLLRWLERRGIRLDHCHTSGHADTDTLARLRSSMRGATLVPIHSAAPERFDVRFAPTRRVADREWTEVL